MIGRKFRYAFLLGATISLLLPSAARAQNAGPPEAFVQPPPGALDDRSASPALIPESVLRKIEEQNDEARRLAEDTNQAFKDRRREIATRRRNAQTEFQTRKDERLARRDESALSLRDRLDEASRGLRSRIDRDEFKNEQIKAEWDAEDARDDREFRDRMRAEFDQRMAEAKKQGEMLIALCTMGFGAAGGLTSMFGSMAGAEGMAGVAAEAGSAVAADAVAAEATAGAVVGPAEGGLTGAEVAQSAGLDIAGGAGTATNILNPSAALEAPKASRLAAVEGGPNYARLITDALNAGKASSSAEIASRGGGYRPVRPPVRPAPRRSYFSDRDPRRNPPMLSPPNNEVRPPLPFPDLQAKKRVDDLGDFLDTSKEKIDALKKLQDQANLTGLTKGRFVDPWHPPMAWPPTTRSEDKGPAFRTQTGPRYGPAVRIQNPWLENPEYDLYMQPGLDGQPPLRIPVPRFPEWMMTP
jgi:hypothetical protein